MTTTTGTQTIRVNQNDVEKVDKFTYLGSAITQNGTSEKDVECRIGKAYEVFKKMQHIWRSNKIDKELKVKIYTSVVQPTLMYACETWESANKIKHKLNGFQQRCLRRILNIHYWDHIRNETVLEMTGQRKIE